MQSWHAVLFLCVAAILICDSKLQKNYYKFPLLHKNTGFSHIYLLKLNKCSQFARCLSKATLRSQTRIGEKVYGRAKLL